MTLERRASLSPGINPFDRREATAEILSPIRKAFADEFC